jgi:hypothetical protein
MIFRMISKHDILINFNKLHNSLINFLLFINYYIEAIIFLKIKKMSKILLLLKFLLYQNY